MINLKGKRFILLHNEKYINYSGEDEVEIGKIIDTADERDVAYILYDKNIMRKYGYVICAQIRELQDGTGVFVIITGEQYRDLFINKRDFFEACAMHELGHYLHGDLTNNIIKDNEEIKKVRLKHIFNNTVQKEELNADMFAVEQLGKSRVINELNYMKQQRLKRKNDPGKEFAIKEYDLRIKAVKQMKL